jgi:hypothetical protein
MIHKVDKNALSLFAFIDKKACFINIYIFILINYLIIFQSLITIQLFVLSAISFSCVITIIVFHSLFSLSNKSIISFQVLLSNAPVGSSANINFGSITKALAIATLCFCHQDNSFGILFIFPSNHTIFNAFFDFSSASLFHIP